MIEKSGGSRWRVMYAKTLAVTGRQVLNINEESDSVVAIATTDHHCR
jgi:hypothetical protein